MASKKVLSALRVAIALLSLGGLVGCAVLGPRIEAPTVTISDLGLTQANLFEQQFAITLRIQNPNPEELQIDGIAFDLEVNGEPFARGVGNEPVTVARYGSATMPVEAVSSLGTLVGQFKALLQGNRGAFRYRIRGTLSVAGSRVPFTRDGQLGSRP